jgi:hypothetical protein
MEMSDPYGINAQDCGAARFSPQGNGLQCRHRADPIQPAIKMDFSLTVFWMGNMERVWEKETRLWHGHH